MPREPVQLQLFRRLPTPPEAPPTPPRGPRKRSPARKALQLAFDFTLRALGRVVSDDDTEYDYPVHRMVRAEDAEPIRPAVARSIFDLGCNVEELHEMARMLTTHGRTGHAAAFKPVSAVKRADGVAQVVGAAYPANRWTPEREEAERIRRAKQKPPKPVRKARTRSKKLIELIGGAGDDE